MAEWRFLRGWSSEELRQRMAQVAGLGRNFEALEEEISRDHGWHYTTSTAVIARDADDESFRRACNAVATYQFSDPSVVVAHFDADAPLLERRLLLEVRVLGFRYLCPALVSHVRDEPDTFGFRYDTLMGHIERGVEWFVVSRNTQGELTFHIEAYWQRGELPNWWSAWGFALLSGRYQRRWHHEGHRRMSLLATFGSTARPPKDASGLTHQGIDDTFIYRREGHIRPWTRTH